VNDIPEKSSPDWRSPQANSQTDGKPLTTKIKYLREMYGAHFANGWDGERTLGELLQANNCESLIQYVRNFRHHTVRRS
jgi:hypothetical protein